MKTLAVAFAILTLLSLTDARSEDLPASWPGSWKEAYERFERFLEVRERLWPRTELSFGRNGAVETEEWTKANHNKHQSLAFFQQGDRIADVGLERTSGGGTLPIMQRIPAGLPTAAVTLVSGDMGYQHIFPLRWFEILPGDGWELSLFGNDDRPLQEIPAPQPEASYWPNERMLSWLDFQVLPEARPNDIREGNRKVKPSAFLQVDDEGTVHRETFFPAAQERLLFWNIFYNGRLIDESPAAGQGVLPLAKHGAGLYIVLLGLKGPSGFLPVSNLLKFALAPRDGIKGLRLLFFSKFDYRNSADYPDWYRAILSPPLGTGPERFADEKELLAARRLFTAYKAAAELGNTSDAAWIWVPPAERDAKKTRP